MALRTIHINGFKSFATDTKIHFYHPVTAIVGPNGSGKSNVADALRFALGEQSMKSLRAGKGEDLIFNGSSKVARKNRAHVSLIFDNSNKIFDIESSEVELERLVHRDGVNEYVVNSSKTRLKDKLELIASANIGPTGHHLITQGEADKFVTATDQERRLLIEDALGLNLYKLRRREAELKLDKTEQKLKEVSKHIWELEPIVKSLSTEVDRLESLKRKEQTLIKLYAEMFWLWERSLSENGLSYENQITDLKNEKKDLHDRIKDLAAKSSEHQELTSEEVELGTKIKAERSEIDELNQQYNDLNSAIGMIDGQLLQMQNQLQALQKKRKSNEAKANISTVAVAVQDVSDLHESIQAANSLLGAKQAEEKFYRNCLGQSINQEEDEVSNQITELQDSINDLLNKKQEKVIKQRSLQHDIESHNESLHKLERLSRDAAKDRLESVRKLEQARSRNEQIAEKLSELAVRQEELDRDTQNFKDKKHKISSIYGYQVLENPSVSLAAGEGADARLRETKRQVLRLEAQLEDADISSLDQLRSDLEVEGGRLLHLQTERHDVQTSLDKTKDLVKSLTNQIETKIEVGIAEVNKNLERFFRVLFGGGSCILRSVDNDGKPGVEIDLKLPYKRLRSVHALSGGERSLASLAILFGITLLSPPPFVVLDETDAALDEANSRRYAKLIRELSEYTQLVLITHNRETMTFADELYGVTMGSDGVSRLLSITLTQGEAIAKN